MIIEDRSRSTEGYIHNEWESRTSKKGILRPRFMSASDYVFYLRRHLATERRRNDPTVGQPGDEQLSVGIPRLSFLLRRLEEDIQSSYLSFLEEFVSEVHEGVSCLLNILRTCQERQKGAGLFTYATFSRAKQNHINRGTIDEFYCLLCLKSCSKSSIAVTKISEHKTGLSTIAACITSSHMKSRMVAIELLTIVSRAPELGNSRVLEAMTTVRILYGESVRFKFLVSILNSNIANSTGLETVTLIFLNTILDQCSKLSDRVRIQSELEEAGLDIDFLEQQLRQKFGNSTHRIWSEIEKWRELQVNLQDAMQKHNENVKLRKEVQLLRDALKRLRDERRGIFDIHKQLKGQWNSMEQRLQDLALKSRVHPAASPSSSDSDSPSPPRYVIPTHQDVLQDSELDEILIDIPTLPATSYLPSNAPPPLPPNHPKLSDSGISSNSAQESSEGGGDEGWCYPEVRSSSKVRFKDGGMADPRRAFDGRRIADIPPGAMILPPGQNKTKCADILSIQNLPLPETPKTQKKSTKKRSSSSSRERSKERSNKSFLPRSLSNGKSSKNNSKSASNLPDLPSSLEDAPNRYNGNNKLWNNKSKKFSPTPQSRVGSSLDGMIHREIANAIRDRNALFNP